MDFNNLRAMSVCTLANSAITRGLSEMIKQLRMSSSKHCMGAFR